MQALMTNCSKFLDGNIRQACYFFINAYLSNFFHSFSNLFGTFSTKMESLRIREKVVRVGEEDEKKMAVG